MLRFARREKRDSGYQRDRARDRRHGNAVRFLMGGLNRAHVNYFLLRAIGEATPQDTHQAEYNQDRSQEFCS